MPEYSSFASERLFVHRVATVLLFTIACAVPASATRRGLLIGIGSYPQYPGIRSLAGPRNDVVALREVLSSSWGFTDLTVLEDNDASRVNILTALDALIDRTRDGDHVFLYFSGHGTSAGDPWGARFGIPLRTGALIPSDIKPGPAEKILEHLIIGRRDLRPRLTRLDQKAEVLVIFDTCYSGDTAKRVPYLTARSAEVLTAGGRQSDYEREVVAALDESTVSAPNDIYPYSRVVYISAASTNEFAWDIPDERAAKNRPTIDGKPHGVLTDALLYGLSGHADTDRNRTITYQELFNYVFHRVHLKDSQTPQLHPDARNVGLLGRPAFDRFPGPQPQKADHRSRSIALRIDPPDRSLEEELRGSSRIHLVTDEYDLLVSVEVGRYTLRHSTGFFLREYKAEDRRGLVKAIARHAEVLELVDMKPNEQAFNISMFVKPASRGLYHLGESLEIRVLPERDCWLFLFSVDPTGHITVLHPLRNEDWKPARGGNEFVTGESMITRPTGIEALKLFAFRTRPTNIEQWAGAQFDSTSDTFTHFSEWLRRSTRATAQSAILLFSTDGAPPR